MTALTLYLTNTAASSVASANGLITPAASSNASNTTMIGTSTGYGEVISQGSGAAWPNAGGIGAASGHGWIYDTTALEGQQIVAGNWTPTLQCSVSSGSIAADLILNVSVYRAGVYTSIGSMSLIAQGFTTSNTTYTFAATSLPNAVFYSGSKLYVQVTLNITTNATGTSTANFICNADSDSTTQIITPGTGSATSFARSIPMTAAFSGTTGAVTARYFRGANVFGAWQGGYGGSDVFPSQAQMNYYHAKGIDWFRVPLRWEALQPTLSGALNATYLANMDTFVGSAARNGQHIAFTLINQGQYPLGSDTLGSSTLPYAAFADFWSRMATHYKTSNTVFAYDLMNEPWHTLDWPTASQAAITAIRLIDTVKPIITTCGPDMQPYRYTGFTPYVGSNLWYQAHVYGDVPGDPSGYGQYSPNNFSTNSVGVNGMITRVQPFVTWLKANSAIGVVGELGVPTLWTGGTATGITGGGTSDSRWATMLDNTLTFLDTNGVHSWYWNVGNYGDINSVEPIAGVDQPMMGTIVGHASTMFQTRSIPMTAAFGAGVHQRPIPFTAAFSSSTIPNTRSIPMTAAFSGGSAMPLSYTATAWIAGTTPLSQPNMTNIENGIVNATNAINALYSGGGSPITSGGGTMTGALSISAANPSAQVGALSLTAVNAGIEMGNQGTVNAPTIDMHSSGNAIDYDVRLRASGGNTGAGNGTLAISAASTTLSGAMTVAGAIHGTADNATNAVNATNAGTAANANYAVNAGYAANANAAANLGGSGTVSLTQFQVDGAGNSFLAGYLGVTGILGIHGTPGTIQCDSWLGFRTFAGAKLAEMKANGDFTIGGTNVKTTNSSYNYGVGGTFDTFDYAEIYPSDAAYAAGTVVCPNDDNTLTRCTHDGCDFAMIVSAGGGFCIGDAEGAEGIALAIALCGRVRVATAAHIKKRAWVTSDGMGGVRAIVGRKKVHRLGYALHQTDAGMVGIFLRGA